MQTGRETSMKIALRLGDGLLIESRSLLKARATFGGVSTGSGLTAAAQAACALSVD